jgi:hypothetical protein
MLPTAIKTIRELILWGYARLMSEKALGDRKSWLFTLNGFEQLNSDPKKWARILQENVEIELNKCAYCGSSENSLIACIVAKKMCPFAEAHNIISACKKCSSSKGSKDLIEWWGIARIDELPRPIMEKYLKMLYMCHDCSGTLDDYAVNTDGKVDISVLACVFKESCDSKKAKEWQELYAKKVKG